MSRIVLCNGVFDILHYGHLLHLEAAAELGTRLIVAVTRNAFVNKGLGRPLFDEMQRVAMVGALRCVDSVILSKSSLDALQRVKPDIFVKGNDYAGKQFLARNYCAEHGIQIVFTNTPKWSATALINDLARLG